MKGYLIANVTVTDPKHYERYKAEAPGVIAKFGGRYLVRGGDLEMVEGDLGLKRLVILEFPSLEQAKQFYHSSEYQEVAQHRMAAATSHIALVEGCIDPVQALRGAA